MTFSMKHFGSLVSFGIAICSAGWLLPAGAQQALPAVPANAPYKQAAVPVEERVRDLVGRMTVEEKARQLDMYRGVSPLTGDDAQTSIDRMKAHGFDPKEAAETWGSLGVGSIHDVYATPVVNNAIQTWVIHNNRLGIPALFAEEGLHGFSKGTLFPVPIGLAATWDPKMATGTGAAIPPKRAPPAFTCSLLQCWTWRANHAGAESKKISAKTPT